MSDRLINIESRRPAGQESAEEIFARSKLREQALSRLLVFYIVSGLVFMLLPGTFLGVWNLISISSRHAAEAISPAWIQAHGHAQIFGWVGSFILGIGFYSIPTVRTRFALSRGWTCAALWVTGVAIRWFTNVYQWQWRAALPISAAMELAAFLIFFRAVSTHEPKPDDAGKKRLDPWIWIVVVGAIGFLATLVMNFGASIYLALRGADPAFPYEFDQRFLVLCAWGFLVSFVWGFSAKWLPVFLGLRPLNMRLLSGAVALNIAGVVLALFGVFGLATVLLFIAAVLAGVSLRLYEPSLYPPKVKGVHSSFPLFVRSAYVWLLVAAALGIWAAQTRNASGIWGASRHALTVGFLSIMVFSIGQRVLPAFSGMRLLFSPRLMFLGLSVLTLGCILRVSSEVLAYQDLAQWAWKVLPVSAVIELTGVTLFAVNLLLTFVRRPAHLMTE
ncbi:MAG TPA: NnrS family protein [Clostridia bacterium]|nr:NnrS family protein [Clostridia bacterium]